MVYVSVQLADKWVTTGEYRNYDEKSTAWATAIVVCPGGIFYA